MRIPVPLALLVFLTMGCNSGDPVQADRCGNAGFWSGQPMLAVWSFQRDSSGATRIILEEPVSVEAVCAESPVEIQYKVGFLTNANLSGIQFLGRAIYDGRELDSPLPFSHKDFSSRGDVDQYEATRGLTVQNGKIALQAVFTFPFTGSRYTDSVYLASRLFSVSTAMGYKFPK